ncbi:hypothetical protein PPYR_10509 [Photinus pyralis]|uniref:Uncharacterized protein n=1 Tax=Photinus pyralis TaxID=7054 RepID=A0A5N4AGV7_PHOPY|nr:hypothetical protein PPYR_10509 [Photinus pyralis]
MMRTATGKFLQATGGGSQRIFEEDRALALDDTQGMFLLLSFGYLLGGISLLSEWLGGCFHLCKRKSRRRRRSRTDSIASNPRSYDIPTPRQKLDSIQYGRSDRRLNSWEEECNPHPFHVPMFASDNNEKSVEDEINEVFNVDGIFGEEELYNDVEEELQEPICKSRNNSTVSHNIENKRDSM